jgi:hypothetical protein
MPRRTLGKWTSKTADRNVRFGSLADMCSAAPHVCFTPEVGYQGAVFNCLLSANNGQMHRNRHHKQKDHLAAISPKSNQVL